MGKIKKILENNLVGGTQSTDVYPVTSVKAVYDENNERLDNIINRLDLLGICINSSEQYSDDYEDISNEAEWSTGLLRSDGTLDTSLTHYFTTEVAYSGQYSSKYSILYFSAVPDLAENYSNVAFFRTDNTFIKSFVVAGGERVILIPIGYKVKISTNDKSILKISEQKGKTIYSTINNIITDTNKNKDDINVLNDRINTLSSNSYINKLIEPIKTYYRSAIASNGDVSNLPTDGGLSIKVYNISENGVYSLVGDWTGYDRALYAFYSSEDISSGTLIKLGDIINNTSIETPTSVNKTITVPQNAKYLAVSVYNYRNGKIPIETYKNIPIKDIIEGNSYISYIFNVTKSGDSISVSRAYKKDVDIKINLIPCGASNLVQIESVQYTGDEGYTNYFYSDLVSPYVMTADENGNEKSGFTGGWHGYNGDQSGARTARTESVIVKCDNVEVEDGTYYCNKVDIIVTNYIQAGNTKQEDGNGREVLKEIVTYSFVNNDINVSVLATALEAITIRTYYGMQIDNYSTNYVFFTDNKIYQSPGNTNYNVPSPTRMIQGINNHGDKIQARLNAIALGSFEYGDTTRYSFCADYGKAYYLLVSGSKNYKMVENDMLYWEGSYSFTY